MDRDRTNAGYDLGLTSAVAGVVDVPVIASGGAGALEHLTDALGAGAIAHLLETRRRQRGQKPPMPLALPDRPGVRDLDLTPHSLESYDDLTRSDPDDPE